MLYLRRNFRGFHIFILFIIHGLQIMYLHGGLPDGIPVEGYIGINERHRNDGRFGTHGAFEAASLEGLHFISHLASCPLGEDDEVPPLGYFFAASLSAAVYGICGSSD